MALFMLRRSPADRIFDGRGAERGSALVYILIAIALLAALTITFMEPSSQQTSSQNTFKTVASIEGQIQTIRSAIQECVLSYPKGDKCINAAAAGYCTIGGVTDAGARKNYPLDPDSTNYTNATPGRSGDHKVKNIRCPGNNGGENANHDNHALIFGGADGKTLPPAPDLFDDWQYYNGTDGVFFWTKTDKTDAYLLAGLKKLDEKYSECEADIIDTSHPAAGDKDLDAAGTRVCPNGSICFRYWMIRNGSAVFNGDADGDEGGC